MKTLSCALALLTVSTAQAGIIIHVDADNCPEPGDGSELDPYCSIQTAIDNAVDTDEIVTRRCCIFLQVLRQPSNSGHKLM